MGCDIHLYVERRRPDGWERVHGFYGARDYELFALLAGVRNDDNVVPISKPRGLPSDLGADLREEAANDHIDVHSHSWLTVAELKRFDWMAATRHAALVNGAEYFRRKDSGETGAPDAYCRGVLGARVISNEQMDEIRGHREAESYFTRVSWEEPPSNYCAEFLTFIDRLSGLGAPDDVRIVFWFDN